MGKKTKLSLDDLKVQSFVTSIDENEGRKVKGGYTDPPLCNSNFTCNFKCGDTAYWECGDTEFCTNTCGPDTLCTQTYGHCCTQSCIVC